jgi:hypothetical protein
VEEDRLTLVGSDEQSKAYLEICWARGNWSSYSTIEADCAVSWKVCG